MTYELEDISWLPGLEKLYDLSEREQYETSLIDFASYVWPVVEPAIPFVRGWVLDAIAEHLQAVAKGDIRRLLINVPPGFTKSLMTDVFFPAWIWGPLNLPHMRFLCASYSEHLTVRDNLRCRNIILSDRYQRLWKDRFGVSSDQFTKIRFANDKTGWKLATSVGGIGTGERANFVLVDDPNNPMEVESDAIRSSTIMWFTEILPDRLNDQSKDAIVVIQQRTHEEDVSGVALSREMGYTHLMVPMEHDVARHCVTVLGFDDEGNERKWEDPRTEQNELAWPERFPPKVVEELKRDKTEYAWAGQYDQMPAPRGGSIIKRETWQVWDQEKFPTFEYVIASLDTAYTTKEENDPSALTIWGVFRDPRPKPVAVTDPEFYRSANMKVMLMWAWQGRLEFNELIEEVMDTCTIAPIPDVRRAKRAGRPRFPVQTLLIEAKAAGLSVGQEMYRLMSNRGAPLSIYFPNINKGRYTQDKVARLHSVEHIFSAGMVYAPDRAWADMVINQVSVFPKGSHDDLVDTASQALGYLRESGILERPDEQSIEDDRLLAYRERTVPLYTPYK